MKVEISDEILKENKSVVEDLIVAAHNNAKAKLKIKTKEEISKAAGGFGIPDLNGHYKMQNIEEIESQ